MISIGVFLYFKFIILNLSISKYCLFIFTNNKMMYKIHDHRDFFFIIKHAPLSVMFQAVPIMDAVQILYSLNLRTNVLLQALCFGQDDTTVCICPYRLSWLAEYNKITKLDVVPQFFLVDIQVYKVFFQSCRSNIQWECVTINKDTV